jgi:tetratricopeptide (TPR) repeat protein
MGETEAAQQLLDRSLFGLRMAYGDDHPMICTVLANHGALCYMLEDFLASRDWYSKALQSTEMILGKDHPSTIPILQSMASVFVAMDADFEDTKVLYERCIETQRRLIGENHPEFLEAQSEYCCFLLQQGHLEDAARGYHQLLQRQEETLGPKHGALMETLSNLGDALSKLGNEDAEAVLRRGLDISSQYGAGKHEIGWECMERLADYLYSTGADLNEAQDLYQKIIAMKRESSNIAPLENYATLDSLASLCVDRGKLEQAIEARREMIELSKSFEEEFNEDRAALLADLAWILDKIKRYDEAEPVYRQALDLLVSTSGDVAERTLQLKAALAWNLENQGRHEEARIIVDQTLEKSRECLVLGPVQLQVDAKAAAVLYRQGERATAIAISQEVLDGSCVAFGDGSDEVRAAQINHTVYLQGLDAHEHN